MSYWWSVIAKAFEDRSTKLEKDGDVIGSAMMHHIAQVFKELAK